MRNPKTQKWKKNKSKSRKNLKKSERDAAVFNLEGGWGIQQ